MAKPPTVAQINERQRMDAEQATLALQARQNEARNPALAAPSSTPTVPAPAPSPEALERNLASWGSTGGTPLSPNGLEGGFQTSGGEKVDVSKTIFAAHLDETRREWIRF